MAGIETRGGEPVRGLNRGLVCKLAENSAILFSERNPDISLRLSTANAGPKAFQVTGFLPPLRYDTNNG